MKIKVIALWATAIIAFALGVWLLVSPSLERQSDLAQQNELLENIMAAVPLPDTAALPVLPEPEPIASYDTVDESPYLAYEQEAVCEYEPAPPPEPLDLSAFPGGIIPIGILTIDAIGLVLPVMEGVDEPELRIAPGRVPETAQIGEIGNAVIAGHRNFTFGSMFNRLGEVEIGDIISFQALSGEVMAFEVFEILVILPTDQIAFIQPLYESIITLYTCTPIREATHRLLIRAIKI
jgi:LPXTG-site transpeptidase (sortase) family protein